MHLNNLTKVNTLSEERLSLEEDLAQLRMMDSLEMVELTGDKYIRVRAEALLAGLYGAVVKTYSDRLDAVNKELNFLGVDTNIALSPEAFNQAMEEDLKKC